MSSLCHLSRAPLGHPSSPFARGKALQLPFPQCSQNSLISLFSVDLSDHTPHTSPPLNFTRIKRTFQTGQASEQTTLLQALRWVSVCAVRISDIETLSLKDRPQNVLIVLYTVKAPKEDKPPNKGQAIVYTLYRKSSERGQTSEQRTSSRHTL